VAEHKGSSVGVLLLIVVLSLVGFGVIWLLGATLTENVRDPEVRRGLTDLAVAPPLRRGGLIQWVALAALLYGAGRFILRSASRGPKRAPTRAGGRVTVTLLAVGLFGLLGGLLWGAEVLTEREARTIWEMRSYQSDWATASIVAALSKICIAAGLIAGAPSRVREN